MAVLDTGSTFAPPITEASNVRNTPRPPYLRLFGALVVAFILGIVSTARSNVTTHNLVGYLRPIQEGAQKALEAPKEGDSIATNEGVLADPNRQQEEERIALAVHQEIEGTKVRVDLTLPPSETQDTDAPKEGHSTVTNADNSADTKPAPEEPHNTDASNEVHSSAADTKPPNSDARKEQGTDGEPLQDKLQDTGEGSQDDENKTPNKPLNIVLLYGDDWRHDSLGVAGTQIVKTPFLDQLSKEGVRFTYNCVTTAVCWVSRATLYSGQYRSRHKSDNIGTPEFYKGWNDSFPYLLRENGYYTGHVGKWHFSGWNDFMYDKFDSAKVYYGNHWYDEGGTQVHSTKKNEADSLEFLRSRPKDSPFCLMVCFFAPHAVDGHPDQYLPQNESMSLYVDEMVEVPKTSTDEYWNRLPDFFTDQNEGRNRYHWRFDSPEKYQTMMKNYYRLISEVDAASGRIIQELEEQGVLNETLIIFTTDNGYFHAEHGLADKWYPHQESIRVPLIIKDPRMPEKFVGKVNDDFTLSIDLASTILAAANIPQPESMQGRDISEIYRNEGNMTPWRSEFFYEHPVHLAHHIIPASEALVRKDHKYMFWPHYQVEQLFDLRNDPLEEVDLIKDAQKQDLIASMRTRFAELKELAK